MSSEKRNVFLLAACLALGMSSSSLIMTAAAIVGTILAPDRTLATLPLALMFVAMMLTTLPASFLMQRVGRRGGFLVGATAGILGGVVSAFAIWRGDYALFTVGLIFSGISNAFSQFYRFAAADVASPAFRPTAISWVMAGGVVAAMLGPNLAKWAKDLLSPIEFAGTFAMLPFLQAGILVLLAFVRVPTPSAAERSGEGRPLTKIARNPTFIAAVVGAVVGYSGMNFVMTATPLAILDCSYTFSDAAFVIQWHVIGMYAPSFFTGNLIKRFGAPRVMLVGALMYVGCVALNMAGTDLMLSFWPALILLGVGWNFLFVGGTTLLTETYEPSEKAKVQGLNDFLVFTAVAISALSSGGVHSAAGWATINIALLILTVLVTIVLLWLIWFRRARAARAAA